MRFLARRGERDEALALVAPGQGVHQTEAGELSHRAGYARLAGADGGDELRHALRSFCQRGNERHVTGLAG